MKTDLTWLNIHIDSLLEAHADGDNIADKVFTDLVEMGYVDEVAEQHGVDVHEDADAVNEFDDLVQQYVEQRIAGRV
jgi:hypothetical protein